MRTQQLQRVAVAAAFAIAAACGGEGSAEAFCSAKASFDAVPGDTPDAAALKAYQQKVRPLIERMDENAPDELSGSVDTLRAAVLEPATLEEGTEAASDASNAKAREDISVWVHDRCGYDQATVVAADNEYTSGPSEIAAGRVSLLLRNAGDAGHAVVLFRAKPGVTAGAKEIATGDPEKSADFVNAMFAAPGTSSGVVLELEPGRYVFFDDEHMDEMFGEFTVS